MSKSVEQVAASCIKRVQMQLLQDLPEPTCSRAKLKWRWQVEQVKKKVAGQLWQGDGGVNVEIKV